ncbi:hypothetical protein [Paraburkholderia sp. Clong3]|uniref:hypothetical protein n=1 Tax=Paraburkholderia sp. Clong3 TaxID=2991061 RepID=UPI003D1CA19F
MLRARIALERLRNGDADRPLINLVSQVTLIARFVVQAGHGKLEIEVLEAAKRGLEDVLVEADSTGTWNVPETLIDGLTDVINEYDRQVCATRMEIFVRASDYLDRLAHRAAARDTRAANSRVQLAQ